MRKIIARLSWFPFLMVGLVFIPLGLSLLIVQPVDAQCGSSASSCKNCHEVNAKYPVNASGDWHTSHAFGDFCAFCHAGNVQAVDESAAHEGMIYPLSDPKGSCASCHANDYAAKAQIYATLLGTTVDTSGSASSSTLDATSAHDLVSVVSQPISPPGEKNASGALIDYNRRYEIEVLGMTDTSQTGNLILWIAVGLLLVVAAVLVWHFEKLGDVWRKARAVPSDDWRRLAYSGAYDVQRPLVPHAPTMPAVPASIPTIDSGANVDLSKLDASTQAALTTLLADPEHGSAILQALARLDPTLIHSLQNLNKRDRDLLLAIVEQLGKED